MTTLQQPLPTSTGKSLGNFHLDRFVPLNEINTELRLLTHQPTGAQVLHLYNDDPENLFCLSFRTLPTTSNGVPHILEHTVLCGSKKYPIRDPFFSMTRRSLNTFMNALTGSDFTCYPAASQVGKDFYNLLEVYLDAVFAPQLTRISFLQEGHRVEFTQANDPSSPLMFKGIVFNEMKGVMASPESRLWYATMAGVFPDITYGIVSGGDPKEIPNLTHDELIDFHKTFYHPSRCIFFFYGNMPLTDHLSFIEQHALQGVTKKPPLPSIPKQPRLGAPTRTRKPYPLYLSEGEDGRDKAFISLSWLTCHILDQEELLALLVLSTVLMDHDASPLKRALLESGLCQQADAVIDEELSEIPFVLVLKGCNEDDASRLENIVFTTLKKLAAEGVPNELVDAALHQLEFHRTEIARGRYPYGLSLFMRSALLQQHGGDAENGLLIHSLFHQLREDCKDKNFLPSLLQKHFINNKHFVRTLLYPDTALAEEEQEREKEKLQKVKSALSSEEKQAIVDQETELKRWYAAQGNEEIDLLPNMALEDIPEESRDYPLDKESCAPLTLFFHNCFTNKIVYCALAFDLPALSMEQLPYVRLFSYLLDEVGCGGRNYIDNLKYIQKHIGGVSAHLEINDQLSSNDFSPFLTIQGKALSHKADKLCSLLVDMTTSLDLSNVERIREVLVQHYSDLQQSLQTNALSYATHLATSSLSTSAMVANQWYGIEYYTFIRDIVEHFDTKKEGLITSLSALNKSLLTCESPHLIVTCDAEDYKQMSKENFFGLTNLPHTKKPSWKPLPPPSSIPSQGRVISSEVSFTAQAFPSLPYTHPDAPLLSLAARIFCNETLHTRIREQGGAYGSGAVNRPLSNDFYFYAFRDPNICSSLQAFQDAVNELIEKGVTAKQLKEAKLEVIQKLDTPISPGSRGMTAYCWMRDGRSKALRQQFRSKLLQATAEEVSTAVKKHIAPKMDAATSVAFAGKKLLERENIALCGKTRHELAIKNI
ncbi:insulinase family protein [Simkania negevensis]|uniref:Insulinase family protein n=1 Tax=Simkania negevensis TaxID=83561 RepID=A0ABS3ASC6_9BACT|nr:insulinase family protein [Simkania negevensis]